MSVKISIIMPVLNREDTIEKAIKSVIDQSYKNFELIILDGKSTDRTVDVIKRYESHLSYWHSEKDGSAAAGTNIGIKKATGDVIGLLMADDWYEPDIFEKIATVYNAHPDADMFTCAGRIVFYDEITKNYKLRTIYNTEKRMRLNVYNICFDITSAICCRFIKKSLYDRIGLFIPFDAEGKQFLTNDKEFLLRAVINNAKDVYVNQMGHTYFAHKASYSFGNNRKSAIKHCQEHMEIAKNYLKKESLSNKQKWLFRYWYNDQSVRLFLYKLLEGDFVSVYHTAKKGIREYNLFWPVAFVVTAVRILVKRISRYFVRSHL